MKKRTTVISIGIANIIVMLLLFIALRIIDYYVFNNNLNIAAYLILGVILGLFYPPIITYSEYY